MNGTQVEVRKNPRSTTWYDAVILDVREGGIYVGFEDAIWPSREVPAASVRQCPPEHSNDGFDPQIDEVVEVQVCASESNPSGWALGRVKLIKNSFYFIGFEGVQKEKQELIVERSALRRVSHEAALDASQFERRLIPVDKELRSWITSEDSLGCLSHVKAKGRLLVAERTESANGKDPQVLIVGFKRNVELAEKLLVQIHFQNQLYIQRFHAVHDRLKNRLSEYGTMFKEVFTIDQELVGRVIGKKGENINLLRSKHDVEINVVNDDNWSSATITVTGNSDEAVKKAREDMEYVTVKMSVEPSQVGWILGRGYQNIADIKEKTGCLHIGFNDESTSLELCGLRQQVEDAKLLIKAHSEYLQVYKEMDEEQHTIQQSFDELDSTGSRNRGSRKGKGDKSWKGGEENGGSGGSRGGAKGSGGWKEDSAKGSQSWKAESQKVSGGKGGGNWGGGGKYSGGYDVNDDKASYPALDAKADEPKGRAGGARRGAAKGGKKS